MNKPANGLLRFFRYNIVGLLGLGVKFFVLSVLVEFAHLGYVLATAIAVESTIVHNFSWHLLWTWGDRATGISFSDVLMRLLRFHAANGVVGLIVNLVVMRLLVSGMGFHYFTAMMAATLAAGCANYLLSEFFIFVPSVPNVKWANAEGKID